MCITFLITGTIVLSMFNFHILKDQEEIIETFYEIEPANEIIKEQRTAQEKVTKAETNKAYNQNQESKHFAYAQKRIAPPKDYVRPELSNSDYGFSNKNKHLKKESRIEKEEFNSFSKANDVLKKQRKESNNAKSSVGYSLVNRKHKYLPTPIYLCEASGKIVVNITVNTSGKVTEASYNNASNSSNNCLIEHAIEYAKKAKFNSNTTQESQIGTITFYFEGK
ncbi:TonB family protein [Oceanihabitans sp. 2_MG-2023]|uniref:TonB family protein n=1 Tax=Oceanihabitans sp. 2_MG-2023 TaxID=3062661 RepID=UPI0026E35370|nr:TonB family protein [Oceanihabitans sp. 2_MG-2023]